MRPRGIFTSLRMGLGALAVYVSACGPPPPPPPPPPLKSDCGNFVNSCCDEFALKPVKLIAFLPTSRWTKIDLTWTLVNFTGALDPEDQLVLFREYSNRLLSHLIRCPHDANGDFTAIGD